MIVGTLTGYLACELQVQFVQTNVNFQSFGLRYTLLHQDKKIGIF